MEIRGIGKTVSHSNLERGQFYLASYADDQPFLVQPVEMDNGTGGKYLLAAIFPKDGEPSLEEIPSIEVYTHIPDVAARIDPMSSTGSNYDISLKRGLLLVHEESLVFLVKPPRNVGWMSFSLNDGVGVNAADLPFWQSYSRWSLVVGAPDRECVLFASPLP